MVIKPIMLYLSLQLDLSIRVYVLRLFANYKVCQTCEIVVDIL